MKKLLLTLTFIALTLALQMQMQVPIQASELLPLIREVTSTLDIPRKIVRTNRQTIKVNGEIYSVVSQEKQIDFGYISGGYRDERLFKIKVGGKEKKTVIHLVMDNGDEKKFLQVYRLIAKEIGIEDFSYTTLKQNDSRVYVNLILGVEQTSGSAYTAIEEVFDLLAAQVKMPEIFKIKSKL